jgi:hypothetical protein
MARAEQVRHFLLSDREVLVFVDSHVGATVDAIERLVDAAGDGIATASCDMRLGLQFAAIHRRVAEAVVAEESRRYSNSAIDTIWNGATVPAVPVASPWNRDGSPLVSEHYETDSTAFMIRAQRAVGSCVGISGYPGDAPVLSIRHRSANAAAPITGEPASQFALCIPSFGALDLDQLELVFQLEKAGMTIFEINGCPWIDQARSYLAEQAMALGKGVFFLDHDIQFQPNDVPRLCEQALERNAVVAGAYCMRRSAKSVIGAFDLPPGEVQWFGGGSTEPALYTGLGFAAIPYDVLEAIEVPPLFSSVLSCYIRPWFALDCSTGFYAGEDVSFCNRVHDLTIKQRQTAAGQEPEWGMTHSGRPARVFIDTRVRLGHRGVYDYAIEDVGLVVPRYESLKTVMTGSRAEARAILQKADSLPVDVQLDMLPFEAEPAPPAGIHDPLIVEDV